MHLHVPVNKINKIDIYVQKNLDFTFNIALLACASLYAHSLCLLQEGRNKNQTQTFGQGVGAMNDLITSYEIVCYEVNAVHYLNQSQGTHMVHLNHSLHFSHTISSLALRARLFFLGDHKKEVLQSFWPTACRNCESARVEMMIPSSRPQRQPSTTKMERGHQKHLQ